MRYKSYTNKGELSNLLELFGNSDEIVLYDDEYQYRIKKKRRSKI